MSIIFESNNCKLIAHNPTQILCIEDGFEKKFKLNEIIFMNFKRKSKEAQKVSEDLKIETQIKNFLTTCKSENLFQLFDQDDIDRLKDENMKLMEEFYKVSNEFKEFHGENNLEHGIATTLNDSKFLIPPNCNFYNKNVKDITKFLPTSEKFDFIVIDPPWTNRYIKRLKKTQKSYQTLSNDDIMNIPIENYTHKSSIVVIWCTNSLTHQTAVDEKFLPKWSLKIVAKWKWIKIDKCGELFCSCEGSKKPYETIYICSHAEIDFPRESINNDVLIFSHPSSIHSHKPQLRELFNHVLPTTPKCLEIFARSLFTNFTSIGTEVLRLQNVLLYDNVSPTWP